MLLRSSVVAAVLVVASATAAACPLCIGTAARSSSQDLDELPRAVLAVPEGGHFRVVNVVKGTPPGATLADVVARDPAPAGKALLLARDESWPTWVSLGWVSPRHAAALRELATEHPQESDAAAWRRRLDAALPHLESREALLAEIAYAECASAPYAALRAAKPRLDVKALRRYVDDPGLASRQPLYVLLLGIAGNARDAAAIEARLAAAWDTHGVANLSSLLAADLELRGPSRVARVEDRYLLDPSRSTAELRAALLALSVQAHSGGTIPRERVIAAYRAFMRAHPDRAGFVAPDLAAWGHWEAAPEFTAILGTGVRQQEDSLAAILAYLRQSPRGAAE
jgi:hypothetical protein